MMTPPTAVPVKRKRDNLQSCLTYVTCRQPFQSFRPSKTINIHIHPLTGNPSPTSLSNFPRLCHFINWALSLWLLMSCQISFIALIFQSLPHASILWVSLIISLTETPWLFTNRHFKFYCASSIARCCPAQASTSNNLSSESIWKRASGGFLPSSPTASPCEWPPSCLKLKAD